MVKRIRDVAAKESYTMLFFELIQVSIQARERLSRIPTMAEWSAMYQMSLKQSLAAICFAGVKRLKENDAEQIAALPPACYVQWLGMAATMQSRNDAMDEYSRRALAYFRGKGFPCQVLKGQGIALLYGALGKLRQSGDIDVWLSGGRKRIYQLSRTELGGITGANYHHIHYPIFRDVEIEAHIYPSFLSSPFRNIALHRFCEKYRPEAGCDDFPGLAFNRVFILLHCYRHLCGHGVGLRQLMDYYFVLRQGFSDKERKETMKWCERLGMKRFAGAAMWVMGEVFGLQEDLLLCKPNEKEGRFLMNEIMHTGNMGHGETRFTWGQNTAWGRFVANQKRNWHLATHYPYEVCWSPFFNIVRFAWQKCKGL
ncbi:MAG: nucleotidyltransferase family protein [Alloprevotella sp.]